MSGNIQGPSRAWEIRAPCIVFLVTTPAFVATRLWLRIGSRSGLGWDDWTILASAVFAIIVMAFMLASCAYGFGQHLENLTEANKAMTLKVILSVMVFSGAVFSHCLFFVSQAFYKLTINMTKMSILLLYLRIFVQRWFRIACYVLLVIIASYMVATFFASVFQCTPIALAWDRAIRGKCINITTNWYANAGYSIATDIIILALPMYPVYSSKLVLKQKIAVMIVFALGAFVVITSILRMTTLNFSSTSPDTTYDLASSVWTIIEENVSITCACLPMMQRPLARLLPFFFDTSHERDGYVSQTVRSTRRNVTSQSKTNWTQLSGYPNDDRDASMNQVRGSQNRKSEDSTDQILPSYEGGKDRLCDPKGIREATYNVVSYSTNKAHTSKIDV